MSRLLQIKALPALMGRVVLEEREADAIGDSENHLMLLSPAWPH